jgi:transcription elongation factor GreA
VFGDRGVKDVNTGDAITYQTVGDDEANIRERKTISSPIARALIGKFSGDIAEVQAPGGIREYEQEVQYI